MKDYRSYHAPLQDLVLENGRFIFEQQLKGFEGKDVLINNEIKTKALIRYHTNPLNEEHEDRKITCWNTIKLKRGDYVKILDEEDNDYIVVTRIKENDLVKYGKIFHCNNVLTFQDSNTLEIYKLPCILVDKTSVYYDGVHKNKLFMLSDDQIRVTIPNNDISKKIIHAIGEVNSSTGDIENSKRLMFNHDKMSIYKITRINTLADKGLIHIVMTHDTYDENTDNLELNIADYKKPNGDVEPIPDPISDYKIIIDGYDSIMFGTTEPYTITVYENDVEVNKELKFEIIGDETLIWIENTYDNRCEIKATKDRRFESVIFRVSLVEDETVYTEMELKAVAF